MADINMNAIPLSLHSLAIKGGEDETAKSRRQQGIKVNFIIKPAKDEKDVAVLEIAKRIQDKNENYEALFENQKGPITFKVLNPTEEDERIINGLQQEKDRLLALRKEQHILEILGAKKAAILKNKAEEEKKKKQEELQATQNKLAAIEFKYNQVDQQYQEYAEIRDRCLKIKVLQDVLDGNEISLEKRVNTVIARQNDLISDKKNLDRLLSQAQQELMSQEAEMNLPLEELQRLYESVDKSFFKIITTIGDEEKRLNDEQEKIEIETNAIIGQILDDGLQEQQTISIQNEKLKLMLLTKSKELSEVENLAKLMNLRKNKLMKDFYALQEHVTQREAQERKALEEKRDEILVLQARLREQRVAPGDTVEQRLESFEDQIREDEKDRWEQRILELKEKKLQDISKLEEKYKGMFGRISTEMHEIYREEYSAQLEECKALLKKRQDEVSELNDQNKKFGEKLQESRSLDRQWEEELGEKRKKMNSLRAKAAEQLAGIKSSIRDHWSKNQSSLSEEKVKEFLMSVVFHASYCQGNDAQKSYFRRIEREIARLEDVKIMNDKVAEFEIHQKKVEQMKSRALDSKDELELDLDQLAIDLWSEAEKLRSMKDELLSELNRFKDNHGVEFSYKGDVYSDILTGRSKINAEERRKSEMEELRKMERKRSFRKSFVANPMRRFSISQLGDEDNGVMNFEKVEKVPDTLDALGFGTAFYSPNYKQAGKGFSRRGSVVYGR